MEDLVTGEVLQKWELEDCEGVMEEELKQLTPEALEADRLEELDFLEKALREEGI